MKAHPTLLIALATALFVTRAGAEADSPRPVAVELFTSQGCSSCPPADALIEKLAAEPGVVAITRPVTYWDQLGWKDTLARPENTDLQRAYGGRNLPGGGVYTPEVVVQGRYGAVGSDERRIRALIAQARIAAAPTLDISGDTLSVGAGTGKATIDLVRLQPSAVVAIGRGENGGRRVRYAHVLRSGQTIGQWTGKAVTLNLPKDARAVGRAAILLRAGEAGPILAARML